MKHSRVVLLGLVSFFASSLGCGPSHGPVWISAYLIPMAGTNRQDTHCMVDTDQELAGDIWVRVETTAKGGGKREYKFHPSDDQDPGPALRFPIEVPEKADYTIDTQYTEHGCGACAICEEYCTGTKKGTVDAYRSVYFEKGQNDNGGQDIEITYFGGFIPFGSNYCECLTETECTANGGRIVEGDPEIGNTGGGGTGGSGTGGTGGTVEMGGSSSGGETATGGNSSGGGTSVDPVCGENMVLVGQYATWCGKVNVHTTSEGWASDSDCTSGCNINTVNYCQKFWGSATAQIQLESPTDEKKLFQDAGCADGYLHKGFDQYACCAPLD